MTVSEGGLGVERGGGGGSERVGTREGEKVVPMARVRKAKPRNTPA